jgi:hypothetical protein
MSLKCHIQIGSLRSKQCCQFLSGNSLKYMHHRVSKMANWYLLQKSVIKLMKLRHMAEYSPPITHPPLTPFFFFFFTHNSPGKNSRHWGGMCVAQKCSAAAVAVAAVAAAEPALGWKNHLGCGRG